MKNSKALHWFRQDLRLSDNPALHEASKHDELIPVYILDDFNSGEHSMGDASRFWLHHSLNDLSNNLNQNLSLYEGDPLQTLLDIITNLKLILFIGIVVMSHGVLDVILKSKLNLNPRGF
jgi:deoxyribodipyrimidine photo-lyase